MWVKNTRQIMYKKFLLLPCQPGGKGDRACKPRKAIFWSYYLDHYKQFDLEIDIQRKSKRKRY